MISFNSLRKFLLLISIILSENSFTSANDPSVVVDTSQGPVGGVYIQNDNGHYLSFFGIPYGENPGTTGRFMPPTKKEGWNELLFLPEEPKSCNAAWDNTMDEDCLTLSVYTKNVDESFPVLVILNPGAFFESNEYTTSPRYFMEKDVVLVVPQFRTGVLGFLSTNSSRIPGNAGAFDVLLALEWVHENIAVFGGDPSQVTLVGQSGGAVIAHALSISPKVPSHLFQKLILQSGCAFSPIAIRRNPVEFARSLAEVLNCDTEEDIDDCLINLPLDQLHLFSVTSYANETPDEMGVKLTIGDYNGLLPASPLSLVQNYGLEKYPLLLGVTKNEGSFILYDEITKMIFFNPTKLTLRTYIAYDLISDLLSDLGVDDSSRVIKYLFSNKIFPQQLLSEGDIYNLIPDLIDFVGTVAIKSPILTTAKLNKYQPTFLYSFDYRGEHNRFGYGDNTTEMPFSGGVCHGDENIYLYSPQESLSYLNANDAHISRQMVNLWTSFAQYGKPVASDYPDWPPFDNHYGPYMKIDTQPTVSSSFHQEFFITTEEEHNGVYSLLKKEHSNFFKTLVRE